MHYFLKKNLKSITETINLFEKNYQYLIQKNKNYKIPKKYEWDFIVDQYKMFKKVNSPKIYKLNLN